VQFRQRRNIRATSTACKAAIRDAEARLVGHGRLLIRRSGTEPLIRVMVEAEDEALMGQVVADVVAAVQGAMA
jgi:phosphoglucosamine mutase